MPITVSILLNMIYGSWDSWKLDFNQTIAYRRYEHPVIVDLLELGYLCTGAATEAEKAKTLGHQVSIDQAKQDLWVFEIHDFPEFFNCFYPFSDLLQG